MTLDWAGLRINHAITYYTKRRKWGIKGSYLIVRIVTIEGEM